MKLIDLDTIDFLEAENNKEFNRGVDNCINRLLKAPIVKAIPIEKLEQTREKMTHYHDGFVMFGRNDIAYAVDNCIKMLDKAINEVSK